LPLENRPASAILERQANSRGGGEPASAPIRPAYGDVVGLDLTAAPVAWRRRGAEVVADVEADVADVEAES